MAKCDEMIAMIASTSISKLLAESVEVEKKVNRARLHFAKVFGKSY